MKMMKSEQTAGKKQDAFLNQKQAAAVLQISTRTLRKMTSAGLLPVYRCGRIVRYRHEEMNAALFKNLRVRAIGEPAA